MNAHETLLEAGLLLEIMRNLRNDGRSCANGDADSNPSDSELDFVNLGSLWQKQFYEIVLNIGNTVGNGRLVLLDPIKRFNA